MSENFWIVVGMSIAYIASFMGLVFAWIHYRRRRGKNAASGDERRLT